MAKHVLKFETTNDYAVAKHNGIDKPNVVYVYENKKTYTHADGTYLENDATYRIKTEQEAEVGDAYIYDYNRDAYGFVSQEEITKESFDLSGMDIFGVVAIPMGFTPDGKIRLVSTNYASKDSASRENGTTDLTKAAMPWGVYDSRMKNAISEYRYSSVPSPYIANEPSPNYCLDNGKVPMDKFFDEENMNLFDGSVNDLMAGFYSDGLSYVISPYVGVDEKNEVYHTLKKYTHTTHSNPGTAQARDTTTIYTMATAYPNGIDINRAMYNDMMNNDGMTQSVINSLMLDTFTDNQYRANIAEEGETDNYIGIYPAALACMGYYPLVTAVTWYLPSISEFIYMATRISKINATLQMLAEKDQSAQNFCQIADGKHWTSTKSATSTNSAEVGELGGGSTIGGSIGIGGELTNRTATFFGGWYCDTTNGEVGKCVESITVQSGIADEGSLNSDGNGHVSYYVRPFAIINNDSTSGAIVNGEIHTESSIGGGTFPHKPISGGL